MKTVKKESVVKSVREVYVANDGTEFSNMEECKKYEESAYGVLNARYQNLVVNSDGEENVFPGVGMDDHTTEAVSIKSQADADTVMQLYLLINSHLVKEDRSEWAERCVKRAEGLVSLALKTGELLLIGRSSDYDESMWMNGTVSSIVDSIRSFVDAGDKKENG